MRVAAAVLVLGACSFNADYDGTHYVCDPRAPSCPPGQTCSPQGVCSAGRGGSRPDAREPDADPNDSPDPDAPPGDIELSFGERNDADVRGVTSDTYLDLSDPARNFGADSSASFDADPTRYALLRFQLTAAPAGAQVDGATLTLYINDPLEDGDCDLAALTESWSEDAANYALRTNTLPWTTPGGTVGEIVQIFTPRDIGEYTFTLPPSLVQGWLDAPATNNGLRFASTSTMGHGGQWNTHESGPPDERPLLRLTLRVP